MAFFVSYDESDDGSLTVPRCTSGHDSHSATRNHASKSSSASATSNVQDHTSQNHDGRRLNSSQNDSTTSTAPASLTTPPTTPQSKARSMTTSSRTPDGLSNRRSIDSVVSNRPLDDMPIQEFPFQANDYSMLQDTKLGSGLWSQVYLANSAPAAIGSAAIGGIDTPPMTPTKARSRANTADRPIPSTYAIKYPVDRSAKGVLTHEARILSALSSSPAQSHIVPFYGQDTRNGSLVLGFLPSTLESYIEDDLNTLSEDERTTKLAETFPPLASRLITGLKAIHAEGVVHGDLKPGNILLDTASSNSSIPTPYIADFSSSTSTLCPSTPPLGAGTWDFLSPALLKSSSAASTPRTDIHALAIVLLCVIFGQSPFDAVQHTYMKRELIKQNQAVEAAYYLLQNFRRMQALERKLGFGVEEWVRKGLGEGEVDLGRWGGELEESCMKSSKTS